MAWVDEFMQGSGAYWPPISKGPGTENINVSLTESSALTKANAQQLFPDAIVMQAQLTGAVTDIQQDPDAGGGDTTWMTGNGAGVVLRVSFPTPTALLKAGFRQEFRVRVRPGT